MSDEVEFEKFMAKILARPMPESSMGKIKIFARELAEGAADEFWKPTLASDRGDLGAGSRFKEYKSRRWNDMIPSPELLEHNNFLSSYSGGYRIEPTAFDLITEIIPTTIFISYRRKDSSAFALLILKSLKAEGLAAFLDVALEPGEDWHAGLKERIQEYDYLILLLGKETLTSKIVAKEVIWALEAGRKIIPIWHNGFKYRTGKWDLSPEIDSLLQNTHTIRVLEESASGYEKALIELLNRFEVTP